MRHERANGGDAGLEQLAIYGKDRAVRMTQPMFNSLRLDGFLSFAPGSPAVELQKLNVLIGPNGSGKSNFFEAFELLQSAPVGLQNFLRSGGLAEDWVWKGRSACNKATVAVEMQGEERPREEYLLALALAGPRLEVAEELFRQLAPASNGGAPLDLVDIQGNAAKVATKFIGQDGPSPNYEIHSTSRQFIKGDESILAQRKEALAYPDLYRVAQQFADIYSFRDWSFGRYGQQRAPQSTSLPTDVLLPDGSNLALFLNEMEHQDYVARSTLDDYVRRYLPRFERLSTRLSGGTTQLYFHEQGCLAPIPAQRLSDGTLRFVAMAAVLLSPNIPPLICLEEPELGQHPDAMTLIAELLREASRRTQVVVTTHSDSLLSHLSDNTDSVLVCEHPADTTTIERLDSEKLKFWLDKYTLGEIWRAGKLGGNP